MGRLTSAANNGLWHGMGGSATLVQTAAVGALAFLVHRVTAVPLVPMQRQGGCCVSYGLSYDHSECCHAFVHTSDPDAECTTPAGFVGGGLRFHDGMSCEGAQGLAMYQPAPAPAGAIDEQTQTSELSADTMEASQNGLLIGGSVESLGPAWTHDETVEPPAGQQNMGGWMASVYTEEQQDRLNVNIWGGTVEDQLWDDGVEPVAVVGVDTSGVVDASLETASVTEALPDDDEADDEAVEAGYDDGAFTDDVTTTSFADSTETGYDDGAAAAVTVSTKEQVDAATAAAGLPGLLPVVINPAPEQLEDDAVTRPCHGIPPTSMAIVTWNPQCDENGQFLAKQCGQSADDCWCVDEDGQTLGGVFISWGFTEDACQAARLSVETQGVMNTTPVAPPDVVAMQTQAEIADTAVMMATEATLSPTVVDVPEVSTTPPSELEAPAQTPVVASVAQRAGVSDLSPKRQLFATATGGAVCVLLFSSMVMMGVQRCRSHNGRASMYAGFTDDHTNIGATTVPKWSKSWVVSGDSLSSPLEPAAPPPEMEIDRVSVVGLPRLGSQMQFSTGIHGGAF